MSKQNLKHRCTVLLSAFFSSAFVTNASENSNIEKSEDISDNVNVNDNEMDESSTNNEDLSSVVNTVEEDESIVEGDNVNTNIDVNEVNNAGNDNVINANVPAESDAVKVENIENVENVEKNVNTNIDNTNVKNNTSRQGLSTPVKLGLAAVATTGVVGSAVIGYKYHQYKQALDEAKTSVSASRSPNTDIGMIYIRNIENSNAVWPLKIKLLKLMKIEKCWFFVNWLRSRIENLPSSDQSKNFDFLETTTFIDKCKGYQSGIKIEGMSNPSAISTDSCLRFIVGYLECNKDDLFSKPPTSLAQIPNWILISRIINKTLKPVGNPEQLGDKLLFKFQTKKNPKRIYELTLKK